MLIYLFCEKNVSVRVRFAGIAGIADFAEFAEFAEFTEFAEFAEFAKIAVIAYFIKTDGIERVSCWHVNRLLLLLSD